MALTTPETADEIVQRQIEDVEALLAPVGGKPALLNSWLNALVVAQANRQFDFYFALDRAALEALPDTAVANLERWAAIYGISRTPGTHSTGNLIATGTVGSIITAESLVSTGAGVKYRLPNVASIEARSIAVTSITRVGSVATVTTTNKHNLGSQVLVSIVDAVEVEYNVVDATITITGDDTFTYAVSGSPSTPATGTITAEFTTAILVVESVEFGVDQDLAFDDALRLERPTAGFDDVVRVDWDGVGGGADQETNEALRDRLLERIRDPVAHFSVADITAAAKTVAGVTRVFVEEITPAVGQVTIYFMRDNDVTAIPGGAEVAAVDAVIQAIRPANSDSADVIVLAPTAVPTAFTFSALTPNTSTMKTAIEASLEQFFAERTTVGVNVDEDAYRSAIFNTVDPATGDEVQTFTISAPSGDITITTGEIGTLGNVTFP